MWSSALIIERLQQVGLISRFDASVDVSAAQMKRTLMIPVCTKDLPQFVRSQTKSLLL